MRATLLFAMIVAFSVLSGPSKASIFDNWKSSCYRVYDYWKDEEIPGKENCDLMLMTRITDGLPGSVFTIVISDLRKNDYGVFSIFPNVEEGISFLIVGDYGFSVARMRVNDGPEVMTDNCGFRYCIFGPLSAETLIEQMKSGTVLHFQIEAESSEFAVRETQISLSGFPEAFSAFKQISH